MMMREQAMTIASTGATEAARAPDDIARPGSGLMPETPPSPADERAQLRAWVENLKSGNTIPMDVTATRAEKPVRTQPLIMVVDDDDIMRKLLSKILKAQHYDVEAVSNAFSALRALQSELPDLILMDVQMPTIDGIELTRHLREIEAYARIPVVMLTGRGEQQIVEDCRNAGATDYLIKPFEREVLLEKLRQHIPQKS